MFGTTAIYNKSFHPMWMENSVDRAPTEARFKFPVMVAHSWLIFMYAMCVVLAAGNE